MQATSVSSVQYQVLRKGATANPFIADVTDYSSIMPLLQKLELKLNTKLWQPTPASYLFYFLFVHSYNIYLFLHSKRILLSLQISVI